MRLRLFVSVFSLVAGLLSLIFSVLGLYLQKPTLLLPSVILSVLVFLAIVVFVFLVWRDVAVRKQSYIGYENAGQMLAIAVDPKKYPLCSCFCATHANGVAAAGLTARAIYISIKHLRTRLLRRLKVIETETTFTPNDLESHLNRFRHIHAVASTMVNGGNLVSRCYLLILQGVDVYDRLQTISETIEKEIITPLAKLYDNIPAGVDDFAEQEPCKAQIQNLLQRKVLSILVDLDDILSKAEDSALKVVANLERDWELDRDALWGWFCKPSSQDVPKPPGIIPACLSAID
jgi:hypothetical protein